jgi:hypothetical protein
MEILDDVLLLNEKDLLFTIWTKPRQSLEFILKHCSTKYVTTLLVLGGVANAVYRTRQPAEHITLSPVSFIFVIVFGGMFGWLLNYLYAVLLKWTGGWLNGKAQMDQFLTVLAWSLVPTICSLILLIPKLLFFEDGLFRLDLNDLVNVKTILYITIELVNLALSIWTVVILVKGIALIQNFKNAKALLNAVLPLLVIFIPLFVIIYLMQ